MDSPPPQPSVRYRNWLDLPRNLTLSILGRLDVVDILNSAQKVCLLWRNICKDPSMWRVIDLRIVQSTLYGYEKMCRHAVDRSCGQLVEIYVDCLYCSDLLLKHIASSSRGLRRLVLLNCMLISDKALAEAAESFPLLEELEVAGFMLTEYLDELGRNCPHLRSLCLTSFFSRFENAFKTCDPSAIAIAENMPELVYLELYGFVLSYDGVQAILDGCPRLQSLVLEGFRHVSRVRASYQRRFSERIKDVRIISDRKEAEALKTLSLTIKTSGLIIWLFDH